MAGCTEPIRREIINEVRHKYQSVIHHTLYLRFPPRFPDGPSPTRPIGLAGCAGAPMGVRPLTVDAPGRYSTMYSKKFALHNTQ